jgi:hypothetical protein
VIELDGLEVTFDLLPGTLPPQQVRLGSYTLRDIEVGGDADPLGELLARLLEGSLQYALEQGPALLGVDWRAEAEALRAKYEGRLSEEAGRLIDGATERAQDLLQRELDKRLGGGEGQDLEDAAQDAIDEARRTLGGFRRRD